MICAKATVVPTQSGSQIHSAPSIQGPRRQSTHQSPVVTHVNYAKNILEKTSSFGPLSVRPFKAF